MATLRSDFKGLNGNVYPSMALWQILQTQYLTGSKKEPFQGALINLHEHSTDCIYILLLSDGYPKKPEIVPL